MTDYFEFGKFQNNYLIDINKIQPEFQFLDLPKPFFKF